MDNKESRIFSTVLSVVLLTTISVVAKASDSYNSALERAKTRHTNVVLRFTADWCMPCKEFEQTVLTDKYVKHILGNYEVYVSNIDAEPDVIKEYVTWFKTHKERQFILDTIPALILVSPNTRAPIRAMKGKPTIRIFLDWLLDTRR